jgi:hypothetical protein
MGWAGRRNGQLLTLAAPLFDVLVTVDRNLSSQQNLTAYHIAVEVLRSRSNRLADLRTLVPQMLAVLPSAPKGVATFVESPSEASSD